MVIYTTPYYAYTFQQAYPQQIVYNGGTLISSTAFPQVVGAPTVIAGPAVVPSMVVQPASTVTVIQHPRSPNLARTVIQGAVQGAAQGLINQMDKHAKSPVLDCFMYSCSVQLRSKTGGNMLSIDTKDKCLDCKGFLGNDYNSHFLVVAKSNNQVILRNGQFENLHLSIDDGLPKASINGTYFRLHETPDHYVTLQHAVTNEFLGVDRNGNLLPAQFVQPYSEEAKFEVNLVYSPYGHIYEPNH